jgi:MFS family permease
MEYHTEKPDAYAVLKIKEFRLFLSARFVITVAVQMQSIIVGWQIYEMTKDPLSLGLIGLSEAIPFIFMAFFSGHIADTSNRRSIILSSLFVYMLCAVTLLLFTTHLDFILNHFHTLPIFIIIAITGFARAFIYPAQTAFMAQLVPRTLYTNSSTWNSTTWHIAAVTGPAIGGLIYGFLGITWAYSLVVGLVGLGFVLFLFIQSKVMPVKEVQETIGQSIRTGVQFVFQNQVVLGALSLDMFAVLFGGAVAMLPVFAAEVLRVGPQGLGFLRAAPAAGAVLMALYLAYHPPLKNTGKKLFISVAGFGLSMILFALSKNFYLSLFLLALSGMFDNISVIVRHTILQLYTPDHMRGRVASVNSVFIGSSNEIGSFESGLAAKLMGLIPSVIFGGGMTLLITGVTARLSPVLRKMHLSDQVKNSEDVL